jgi:hypothetical protein
MKKYLRVWIAAYVLVIGTPLAAVAGECAPTADKSDCVGDCPKTAPECIILLVDNVQGQGWKVLQCQCIDKNAKGIDTCHFVRLKKEDKGKEKEDEVGDFRCVGKCKDGEKEKCTLKIDGDQRRQIATCKCQPKKDK